MENELSDWREELNRLWELRKTREENFAILVNCIQLATVGLEIKKEQEKTIWKIIDVLSKPIDNDALSVQTLALENAGLDVYRGLR